jgi:hypothetical protein
MSTTPPVSTSQAPITSGSQFFLLIFRFFAGPGALFICLLLLLRRQPWDLSAVDAVFWGTLVLLVYLHRRAFLKGTSSEWRGAAVRIVALAGVLWVACHSMQLIQ